MTTPTLQDRPSAVQMAVARYAAMGWRLVGIPAGSKAPKTYGWQQGGTAPEYWDANPTHNVGLLHSLSGTCALDIDSMASTRTSRVP